MTRLAIGTALLLSVALETSAASTAFQSPDSASWGDWRRHSPGSVYVHWEEFNAFMPVGFPSALPDASPDRANVGARSAVLIPNNPGAFVTGSGAGGNLYSFGDINDFDVIVQALDSVSLGPLTVALQVAVVGTNFNHASIRLNGSPFSSRTVLATGTSTAPGGIGGVGGGVDNEYLYLWRDVQRVSAAQPFIFDLVALGTSNSLDALAIDIGPAAVVTPPPAPVPLPASVWLFGAGLGAFVSRARSSA